MDLSSFQQQIEAAAKKKIKLRINDNRSTMLSVKWEPDCTKVSMHRMFLEAPENIMDELSCHIARANSNVTPAVRKFIEESAKKYDYAIDLSKLQTLGDAYDLQKQYDIVNNEYFKGALDLHITWYGQRRSRSRSRITFGLYQDTTRLIKIHRLLDRPTSPEYLINFVIYHEMLHHVCPAYYDQRGLHKIHTKEFLLRERQFREYEQAKQWINSHLHQFFMR